MATLNIALKVNRAISAPTTVNTNCYAEVEYQLVSKSQPTFSTSYSAPGGLNFGNPAGWSSTADSFTKKTFGPGQAVPNTYALNMHYYVLINAVIYEYLTTYVYQLVSGVEFANTQ